MIVREVTEYLKEVRQVKQIQERPAPIAKPPWTPPPPPPLCKDAIKSMWMERYPKKMGAVGLGFQLKMNRDS